MHELYGISRHPACTLLQTIGQIRLVVLACRRQKEPVPESDSPQKMICYGFLSVQDTLETREELEALQGLIERLELDAQSKAASYAAGAPGQASQLPAGQSTRELYQALASRAAALQ
jgi:hypothetical protein